MSWPPCSNRWAAFKPNSARRTSRTRRSRRTSLPSRSLLSACSPVRPALFCTTRRGCARRFLAPRSPRRSGLSLCQATLRRLLLRTVGSRPRAIPKFAREPSCASPASIAQDHQEAVRSPNQCLRDTRCDLRLRGAANKSIEDCVLLAASLKAPDGGPPRDWSPDGFFVLYEGKAGLRVFGVREGKSWPLYEPSNSLAFVGPDTSWSWRGDACWSPDGTFVVATIGTRRTQRLAFSGVTLEAVKARVGRH